MPRRLLGLLALPAVLLVPATAANAAPKAGSVTDAKGDGPAPSLDITRLKASYDSRRGTLRATITLAAPLNQGQNNLLGVIFGKRKGGKCGPPQPSALIGGQVGPQTDSGFGFFPSGEELGKAKVVNAGRKVTISGTHAQFKRKRWNCATGYVGVTSPADTIARPIRLR